MKCSVCFLSFFACLCISCNLGGKTEILLSASTRSIVDSVAKDTIFYNTEHDEFSLNPLPQWALCKRLAKAGSLKELEQLSIEQESQVVRMVAFRALLEKNAHAAVKLFLQQMHDSGKVNVEEYCESYCGNVPEERFRLIYIKWHAEKIIPADTLAIDSVLFNTPGLKNLDGYVGRVVENKPSTAENYSRIRSLAKDEHNVEAIVKLADYRKLQDTVIIQNALLQYHNAMKQSKPDFDDIDEANRAILVVAAWPDKAFISGVKTLVADHLLSNCGRGKIWSAQIFVCLRKYKSKWADDLIRQSLNNAKSLQKSKNYDTRLWANDILSDYRNSKTY